MPITRLAKFVSMTLVLIFAFVSPTYGAGAETPNDKGFALLETGGYLEAVSYFRKAIEIDPGCPIAWNNLGCAYYRQREFATAQQCFSKAVELNPCYSRAWLNLSATRFWQGKYADAYKAYRLAKKADRKYVLGRLEQAQTSGKLEKYRQRLIDGKRHGLTSAVDPDLLLLAN